MGVHFLLIALTVVSFAVAQSPTCYEGFNMSIAGIPLYHWADRECSNKSQCFIQELQTEIYDTKLDVVARYGGCISSSYAPLVKCENLFGPNSTFNPGILINMIPDLKDHFDVITQKFTSNVTDYVRQLFSSGKGSEQFIAGCYKFLENVGFDMEKSIPLQKHIVNMFNLLFVGPADNYTQTNQQRQMAVSNFLLELSQQNTENYVIAKDIYSFLSNWEEDSAISTLKVSKYYALVEVLPELIKLALPKSLNVDKWYDVIFELLGDVNIAEPTQTAKDIVNTIKTSWELPKEYSMFINPILDSIPGIVDLAITDSASLSLEILQHASLENAETERLSAAAKRIVQTFVLSYSTMSPDLKTLVQWLPGLAYKLFPENTNEINRVYTVLADGLEAMDFADPTSTMEKTNMSEFFLLITEKTNYIYRIVSGPLESKQMNDLIIINVAKTVYDLIPEYTTQLDIIFSTLLDGFKNYPYFNYGGIISSLIINLGKKIPIQILPILHRVQDVWDTIYNDTGLNFKPEEFHAELNKIISDYERIFPDSEFPDLVRKILNHCYEAFYDYPKSTCYSLITDWSDNYQWDEYQNCAARYTKEISSYYRVIARKFTNTSVDLQFALFRALDFDGNMLFEALLDAFPDFDLYIKSMRLLDASDVKTLTNEFVDLIYSTIDSRGLVTVDTVVAAVNSTLITIAAKLDNVMKELRSLFSPDTCRYISCDEDLCNTQDGAIALQEPFKRNQTMRKFGQLPERTENETTSKPLTGGVLQSGNETATSGNETTTTGGSGRPNATVLLNALAVWVLAKIAL